MQHSWALSLLTGLKPQQPPASPPPPSTRHQGAGWGPVIPKEGAEHENQNWQTPKSILQKIHTPQHLTHLCPPKHTHTQHNTHTHTTHTQHTHKHHTPTQHTHTTHPHTQHTQHTHPHTTHTPIHTHTQTHTLSPTHIHIQTPTQTHTQHTHTLTHTNTTHPHTHTLTHPHTPTHTLSHTLTHPHTHSHTHTHSHPHTHTGWMGTRRRNRLDRISSQILWKRFSCSQLSSSPCDASSVGRVCPRPGVVFHLSEMREVPFLVAPRPPSCEPMPPDPSAHPAIVCQRG
uniref:Uncharacterized protein n=1 Tax=Molossus molossus TaxID=27622 RepID=A0A7J8ESQ3_MOLMO|nr:hypothetical protein HJG59_008786 [Molossus molossus]